MCPLQAGNFGCGWTERGNVSLGQIRRRGGLSESPKRYCGTRDSGRVCLSNGAVALIATNAYGLNLHPTTCSVVWASCSCGRTET